MRRKPAKTYDEIVRRTVISPDLTFRPSESEERASVAAAHGLARERSAVASRVRSALREALGDEADRISLDVETGMLTLQGEVASAELAGRAEAIASAVPGVDEVDNQLVITR